jgi:hypothetical protein
MRASGARHPARSHTEGDMRSSLMTIAARVGTAGRVLSDDLRPVDGAPPRAPPLPH